MDRAELLTEGRAFAEEGMVDACVVEDRTGETTDPFSGVVVGTYEQVYAGKCRFTQGIADAQQVDVAEDQVLLQRVEVQLPVTATGIHVDARVTVTAAGRDPDLVGRVFRVRHLMVRTDATARRLGVEEVTS